jgi:cell wall-associated NlpC family hydrolase
MTTILRATGTALSTVLIPGLIVCAGPSPASAVSVKSGENAVATTEVNIRSGASTSSRIVGELERGQRIPAVGQSTGTWVKVRFNGSTAYVSARYLNTSGRKLPAAPKKIPASGTKITTLQVNVRSGAGVSHSVVGSLAEGTKITLTGKMSGGFAQTRYQAKNRWVSMAYLARFVTPTTAAPIASKGKGQQALAFARRQLGKPYKFGAEGPRAYDCSGLVMAAWRSVGVSLPRTSQQQFRSGGRRIAKSELRAGDLVFFYGPSPSHVAMYVGGGRVIHAPRPGKVVQYIKMSYMPYAGAVRPA